MDRQLSHLHSIGGWPDDVPLLLLSPDAYNGATYDNGTRLYWYRQ